MEDNNRAKTIIKNTIYLYIRMFVVMGISFITSRLILNTLGVENYGINNVVGGIIAMFSILNTTMSGATSRFITYELVKGKERVQKVFSTALIIHFIIAIIVIIMLETVGYWFLVTKLIIPIERLYAAKIILQFSIITLIFNFTQVPYNASIIAYEKMKIYAIIGTLDSVLKLVIAIAISFCKWDKLIFYGFLIMSEQIFITLLYRYYCTKKFQTCRFILKLDKKLLKPMLTYSIWDIFGQGSIILRTQGVNMLLNMFFGVVINAATGICTQVQTMLITFTQNIMTAFRPQIIKCYADGKKDNVQNLIHLGAISTFLLFMLIAVPILIEMDFLLTLWLKNVPEYTVIFCKLITITTLFGILSSYPMMGIDATGKIRDTSIIIGILYIIVIPTTYLFYKFNHTYPWIPYVYNAFIPIMTLIVNSLYLNYYIKEFSFISYQKKIVLPALTTFIIDYLILYTIYNHINNRLTSFIICTLVGILTTTIVGYTICYNKKQKTLIKSYIIRKLSKNDQ